jgi:hypothetical protein
MFKWMRMEYIKTMKFDEIQSCIEYLQSKQVQVNDSKLFDHSAILKPMHQNLMKRKFH